MSDVVVVINTKDESYARLVSVFCSTNGIEYHRTKCDGTPANGKNSVLDLFLESDNDYMVMIDGDDYLTPHGVWVYNHLAQVENPPDAVFLWDQKGWKNHWWENDGKGKIYKSNPFVTSYGQLDDDYKEVNEYREVCLGGGRDPELLEEEITNLLDYWQFQRKYCEPLTTHCRLTFLSRNAAKIKFPKNVTIGEDTLHYFLLKNERKKKRLNVVRNCENPPTYIYDQSQPGTVIEESNLGQDYSWLGKMMAVAREYEKAGIVHENYELPDLKIDYPPGYYADQCGYGINSIDFEIEDSFGNKYIVHFPSNASDSSIIAEKERIYL